MPPLSVSLKTGHDGVDSFRAFLIRRFKFTDFEWTLNYSHQYTRECDAECKWW